MTDPIPDGTIHLTRSIPVPTSVSAQAQATMAAGAAVVADRLAHPQVSPALDDTAAWKAWIAATDESIMMGFAGSRTRSTRRRRRHRSTVSTSS